MINKVVYIYLLQTNDYGQISLLADSTPVTFAARFHYLHIPCHTISSVFQYLQIPPCYVYCQITLLAKSAFPFYS